MLGFLVVDKDLEIVKVSFAVVTPGPLEDLVNIRMFALRFPHGSQFSLACSISSAVARRKAYNVKWRRGDAMVFSKGTVRFKSGKHNLNLLGSAKEARR